MPCARTEEETGGWSRSPRSWCGPGRRLERDGYSREIELVPGSEVPTRLEIVLTRLLGGLDAIGCDREKALGIVTKAGLDSIPALRFAALDTLDAYDGRLNTNEIADAVGRHPAQTTRRALEDLMAHGLVDCHRSEDGKAHQWTLTEFARSRFEDLSRNTALSLQEERKNGNRGVPAFRERSAEGAVGEGVAAREKRQEPRPRHDPEGTTKSCPRRTGRRMVHPERPATPTRARRLRLVPPLPDPPTTRERRARRTENTRFDCSPVQTEPSHVSPLGGVPKGDVAHTDTPHLAGKDIPLSKRLWSRE